MIVNKGKKPKGGFGFTREEDGVMVNCITIKRGAINQDGNKNTAKKWRRTAWAAKYRAKNMGRRVNRGGWHPY